MFCTKLATKMQLTRNSRRISCFNDVHDKFKIWSNYIVFTFILMRGIRLKYFVRLLWTCHSSPIFTVNNHAALLFKYTHGITRTSTTNIKWVNESSLLWILSTRHTYRTLREEIQIHSHRIKEHLIWMVNDSAVN